MSKINSPELTRKQVRDALDYNPETGNLTWKQCRGGCRAGGVAGTLHSSGYWRINFAGELNYAHRLVWLHVHGRFPIEDIDHIDGNRLNNMISNLRECSRRSNNTNKIASGKNTSGTIGVHFDKARNKWVAHISVDVKCPLRKRFNTKDEAIVARLEWVKEFYGEFSFEHSQALAEYTKSTTSSKQDII
jgi:hypothetical protein